MASFKAQSLVKTSVLTLLLGSMACGAPPDTSSTPSADVETPTPTEEGIASVSLDATALDFGTVILGGSVTQDVVVTNTGNLAVSLLSVQPSGRNSEWFSVSGLSTIAVGESTTLTVTFAPASDEAATATLLFITNPDDAGFEITAEGIGGCIDNDGDGFCSDDDCNDNDNDINDEADEVCDGEDNDCDGSIDNNPDDGPEWYVDADEDTYGADTNRPTVSCEKPRLNGPWVEIDGDCDDTNPDVNAGALEICDGVDNNCDRQIDEGDAEGDGTADCLDDDNDGYCEGETCSNGDLPGDCDDTEASVFPGNPEIPLDELDNNCNGTVDENSVPVVTFLSPAGDTPLLALPSETAVIVVQTIDAEDGYGLTTTISSDVTGTLCEDAGDAEGILTCEATLAYGAHALTASATDSEGETVTSTAALLIDTPPTVAADYPVDGAELPYGSSMIFTALIGDEDPEQTGKPLHFVWESSLGGILAEGNSLSSVATADVTLYHEGAHTLTLTVTDELGADASISMDVSVGESPCAVNRDVVALYHFDDGSGIDAADSSGNGLTADVNAEWVTGKFDSGVDFNGSDSYVKIANTADLLSLQSFTVEAWVSFRTPPIAPSPSRQPIFQKLATAGSSDRNYDVRVATGGTIQASVDKSEGVPPSVTAIGSTILAKNDWNLVSATYDGNVLNLYLNGVLEATNPTAATLVVGEDALYLGTDAFSGATQTSTMNGTMDEVRIMNCALSEPQILAGFESDEPFQNPTFTSTPTPTDGEEATSSASPTPDDSDRTPTETPQ